MKTTLAIWRMRYRLEGYEAFLKKRKHYSEELKLQAVMDDLYDGLSQYQVVMVAVIFSNQDFLQHLFDGGAKDRNLQ